MLERTIKTRTTLIIDSLRGPNTCGECDRDFRKGVKVAYRDARWLVGRIPLRTYNTETSYLCVRCGYSADYISAEDLHTLGGETAYALLEERPEERYVEGEIDEAELEAEVERRLSEK